MDHRKLHHVGLIRLRAPSPYLRHPVPVTIWYPTAAPEEARREGIYDLSAAYDAPPTPGSYGLVVISHGSGGSDINHHDWAEALARAGYVVAAPRHIGDSHDVNHGIGSREQLLQRPRQLKAALEAALGHETLRECIDPERIGVLGFSAGGYTSMVLLGARPDFSRWGGYCKKHPESAVVCPIGKTLNLPKPTPEDWDGVYEPRIRAAVLLAPFAMLFDAENIAKIKTSVRLYRAENESIARNPSNADSVAQNLPGHPEVVTVEGDHYVFIAPVEDSLARKYHEFYIDAPGVNRRAIHERLAGEIIDFYDRKLGCPP